MPETILYTLRGVREEIDAGDMSEKQIKDYITDVRRLGATNIVRSGRVAPEPVHNPEDDECA